MTVILFKLYGYVTCSHGTDCHAELPAGNLRSGVNIFLASLLLWLLPKADYRDKEGGHDRRLPAGSVQRFKMAKIDPVSPYYPGFHRIFFSYRYCWFAAKSNREPYQTVSTVYFILGILRTDLSSQGTLYPTL